MNRPRIALYHALGWALLIAHDGVGVLLNYSSHQPERLLFTGTLWLSQMILFYYCFSFVYPRYWRPGRGPQLLLGLLATPLVFGGVRYVIEEVLMPAMFGLHNYDPGSSLRAFVIDDVYLSPPVVVLAALAWKIEEVFRREKDHATQLLTQEKTQAELAFLRTQINPHFLYNTLNYLYAEAYAVSEPLAGAVLRLSDLMRYLLHEGPDGQVELRKEVAYLENYLALHRLRFEDQFFVNFRQPAAVGGQRVAALLLVPFVENALKHGVLHRPDQPVDICLALPAPGRLRFEVRNHVGPHQRDATTGIGLANLRRRLALLYPGRHTLAVHNDGTVHYTRLELDLGPGQPASPPPAR
ncbi:MAG: sensor histidine kinase [Janthinobacterium lividum]